MIILGKDSLYLPPPLIYLRIHKRLLKVKDKKGGAKVLLFLFLFFCFERRLSGGHFTQIKHATLLRPISILGACAYQSIGTVKQSRSLR